MQKADSNMLIDRLNSVDWNFSGYNPNRATIHNIHWYPAVFFRGIVATAIDMPGAEPESGLFLDPFSGSGLASIEAWLRGWRSVGVDNNSLAIEISQVKAQLIEECDELDVQLAELLVVLDSWFALPDRPTESDCASWPDVERFFDPRIGRDILHAYQLTDALPNTLKAWRSILRVAISSALHKPLSILRDVNHSYVIDRSRAAPPSSPQQEVLPVLRAAVSGAIAVARAARAEAIARLNPLPACPTFIRGTFGAPELTLPSPWTISITSPPYFGMNDYVRSGYLTRLFDGSDTFSAEIASELGPRRRRTTPAAVDEYLEGLSVVFSGMRRSAAPDAFLFVVMGESSTKLAVEREVLAQSLASVKATGFDLLWRASRRVMFRKINSQPHRREDLWVLRPI